MTKALTYKTAMDEGERREMECYSLQTIQIRFDGNSRRWIFEKSADVTREEGSRREGRDGDDV